MTPKCIIFDCDGTLVDSEGITNQVIAEMAGELGVGMTGEEASSEFGGKTLDGVLYKMKEMSGKEIPDDWLPRLVQMVSDSWESKLRPVRGVNEILEEIEIPVCVASNGEPTHVKHSLILTELYDFFGGNIFTASEVNEPKPSPEIFLYAAKKMGFEPSECVVIEDSVTGVKAAVKANMKVYGIINNLFTETDLKNAGAIPFKNMLELPKLLGL
jgi:HAD superfamily hydrolase (TIGR01509 family)